MTEKIFTPQEANRRLPLIRLIVEEILEKGRRLRALQDDPSLLNRVPWDSGRLEDDINALVRELEQLGCFYKDWNFDIGLVDFPALIDGLSVFLCWRSDEPDVRWYHAADEGYTGRKPVPENLLSSATPVPDGI